MKYKRGWIILLAAILMLTSGLPASYAENNQESSQAAGPVFSDISGHWAEDIIKEAVELHIVNGYPDGTFRPDNLIKREEFFKLLTGILTEQPDTSNIKLQFTDVAENSWYAPTIKTAVAAGITLGYGDGTFGIGVMISRQESAKASASVISAEFADKNNKGAETAVDKDQIADWAYSYVDLMFKKGYMKGDANGSFRPTMALTRAEAAAILTKIKKNEPVVAANLNKLSSAGSADPHGDLNGVFTKGKGSQNDPYQIATEEQLNHMRMHATEGAYFILTKNIAITKDYATLPPEPTLDGGDWSGGNFEPIGSKTVPFKGNLNGDGYIISGLDIIGGGEAAGEPDTGYTGLFGYLAPGSGVTNLTIDASNIKGGEYTGAVAGASEGMIKGCRTGSRVKVEGTGFTGGLVGMLGAGSGEIIKSKNTGDATGVEAGGIAGSNRGKIIDCYNSGTVRARLDGGGIAGCQPDGKGNVSKSYNEGSVSSDKYAGGVVGENDSEIENSYNSGRVDGAGAAGGISGINSGAINNVYDAGMIRGGLETGGLAGRNNGQIVNAYWLEDVAILGAGLPDGGGSQQGVSKVTREELSGQKKISSNGEFVMLIDLLNGPEATSGGVTSGAVWKYAYKTAVPTQDGSAATSGGITLPLDTLNQDSAGNTIDPSDMLTKYLYPCFIN